MFPPRVVGIGSVIMGLVLATASALFDYTGLSATPHVIGWYQWIGVTAGAILFILGLTVVLYTDDAPQST